MKSIFHSTGAKLARTGLLAALALFSVVAAPASNTLLYPLVDLGYAGKTHDWAIFSLGGGVIISDNSVDLSNPAVIGNVGNGGTVGGISLNSSVVEGSVTTVTGGTLTQSGGATILGNTYQGTDDTNMSHGVSSAIAAGNQAFALSNSPLIGNTYSGTNAGTLGLQPTVINTNAPLTLTGSGNVVLHLSDFILSNGAALTLSGTASTTFVVNVTGKFFLTGGKVLLSGGLTWDNVLFNVRGTGLAATFSSAAQFSGFLLVPNRTVTLSGSSSVTAGSVIANQINLSSGSRISRPANPSPF